MPSIDQERRLLPTYEYKQDLIDAIREHSFLVVIGETGSGKTTQIPQYILEEMPEMKKIGVTQPRRIAAITVSKRVSEEHGTPLGKDVGYLIRFDDHTSSSTRLKYMTDGILLREAVQDPTLSQYSVVIVDEAHERTLETDVLFGLLKKTHRLRPELKILVMSATLDVEKFSDFFDECPIFEIPGRTFPVQIIHHQSMKINALKSNFVSTAVETAFYIHTKEKAGDVLVFLTGQADIDRACQEFKDKCNELDYNRDVKYYDVEDEEQVKDVSVYPLYASLETMEQRAVFELSRRGSRKVVFSTNVAQTSVTIPGIKYVVDSGFVKEKSYDPNTGMDALLVTSISKAAATQRAGRAGRTAPGKAYRLYSSESFEQLPDDTIPEIQRSSLLSTVLALKRMNIVDVLNFEFIDKPDETLVMKALSQLFLLGAIDNHGVITELGKQMSQFPLSPYLSRVIISSAMEYECSEEVLTIASVLAGDNDLFRAPSPRQGEDLIAEAEKCKLKLAHHSGDHMTILNVWNEWRRNDESRRWCRDNWVNHKALANAKSVRSQLIDIANQLKLPMVRTRRIEVERTNGGKKEGRSKEVVREVDAVPVLKSFLTGYYTNIANKASGRSVFSHYAPDQHLAEKSSHTSSALVALYLHPLCALSDMFDRNKTRYSQIEWVMYMHVTYTNRAVMKGVSKILWDWVRSGKGHERIRQLATAHLNGVDKKKFDKKRKQLLDDSSAQASSVESSDTEAGSTDAELEEDRRRLRKLEIDDIRKRALARRGAQ
ncbi:hypothetical protein INT44_001474 [Umbelopsis vinacea]|uniref:RNA helicase n=1 Tax=Umbelopsis vinacea TaxID=44442 RepID=A0A8H7PRR8_9FUNG|nr:hypothetical protein INT44_001474 [Umbelopsis vinacea]KAI9279466.1 P-loop containing nucleoside triphosphate hydrolase protein [Umbelopsis sp. AD052]